MAFKRLPNNFGTVYKLSGNRRRPWIARRRVGELYDDEKHYAKPIYQTIGYYSTRTDAMKALSAAPENLTKEDRLTFGEVFDLWEKDKYGDDGISHNYASAKKHLAPIFRRKIADLKTIDLENTIMMDGIPRTMRQRVKIMITQVYDYAMRHEIVTKDYSALIRVSIDLSVKHEKTVFTASEVKKVWNSDQEPLREITLILLYTGMRINELLTMTADSVKDGYIVTGSKSEAGKNRVIPIHPEIADIIAGLTKTHKGKLFHLTPITVRKNMVNAYGHIPHECRHSFATQAMECGMNDEARKRILGHASVGVTNQVYTHLDIEFLKSEMKKLKY